MERAARVARNEVLFRAVNERVVDVHRDTGDDELIAFVCECGTGDCTESIHLTLDEYETVRSVPTHFALAPGHETQNVETVVARSDRFVVVEKHLSESGAALRTDPRG
jgi:hypothetical protein